MTSSSYPYAAHSSSAPVQCSSSSIPSLPPLLQDAVATSAHLRKFSAVHQLTKDLQQREPRHPKGP